MLDFAADDHVDVSVRQQLASMLLDNAEMRKQLNAYTEGILMQTLERVERRPEVGPTREPSASASPDENKGAARASNASRPQIEQKI